MNLKSYICDAELFNPFPVKAENSRHAEVIEQNNSSKLIAQNDVKVNILAHAQKIVLSREYTSNNGRTSL